MCAHRELTARCEGNALAALEALDSHLLQWRAGLILLARLEDLAKRTLAHLGLDEVLPFKRGHRLRA